MDLVALNQNARERVWVYVRERKESPGFMESFIKKIVRLYGGCSRFLSVLCIVMHRPSA